MSRGCLYPPRTPNPCNLELLLWGTPRICDTHAARVCVGGGSLAVFVGDPPPPVSPPFPQGAAEGPDAPGAPSSRPAPQPPPEGESGAAPAPGGGPGAPRPSSPRQHLGAHRARGLTLTPARPLLYFFYFHRKTRGGGRGGVRCPSPAVLSAPSPPPQPPPPPRAPFVRGATPPVLYLGLSRFCSDRK